jgi:hypothetical protein
VKRRRKGTVLAWILAAAIGAGAGGSLLGTCGPFTDFTDAGFCPLVLEIFYLGITTGTTPTTFDPNGNVTRLQMAAFLSRSVDGVLKRGSRRAALNRFWTTEANASLALTTIGVGTSPQWVVSDGEDVWVALSGAVTRVHGSDGKVLQTWTGAGNGNGVLSAFGKIFATGNLSPGQLYAIDPSQPAGAVTTVATNLGNGPFGLAYDGSRIWTAENGSVSIVTPSVVLPWTVTTVTTGFVRVNHVVFDGAHVWATNPPALVKLDASGAILQTVTLGGIPLAHAFDGSSFWVPLFNTPAVAVVRASNGAILATLTGNGLDQPGSASFDGQRVLVTNFAGGSVSLWKAADLTPLGSFAVGPGTPNLSCSDGVNFWITLSSTGRLARF